MEGLGSNCFGPKPFLIDELKLFFIIDLRLKATPVS